LPDDLRELVSHCLTGDQTAMVDLVDRYRDVVFGLCFRMLRHRQDAEDTTQEVFVRAFRNLARFDVDRKMKPWLLAIASNRCRTVLATRMRRAQLRELVADPQDPTPDYHAARNLAEEVMLALSGLRREYSQAFLLFHKDGLSYAEIGEVLDCPIGTVKTWVHRARHEIAAELRKRGVVEETRHDS